MEAIDVINVIEQKIKEIHADADNYLIKLGKRKAQNFPNVNNMHDCDYEYMNQIAKYAWGERGKKIGLLYLQGTLNELKSQLNNK